MGRFDPRWHDEHREAIIGAVLDQGHSIRHAQQLGAQGALKPAPFDMPYSTCREYVNNERRRREKATEEEAKHGDPASSLDHLIRRSLTLLDAWLRKLERSKEPQPRELERVLRGIKAAQDLLKPSNPKPRTPKQDDDAGTKDDAEWSPAVASMLKDMQQEGKGTTDHRLNDDEPATEPEAKAPSNHYYEDARDREQEPDRAELRAQLTA